MKIEINQLNPHFYNSRIYGFTDNTELIQRIKESGWVKPIIITQNNTIISGHRRVEACKALNINSIEFEYAPDDYIKQLELFIGENCYREKSTFQKVKEAEIYLEIEKKKAYMRMAHIKDPVETIPQAEENIIGGKTRDIVAQKVGMSGRSLDKALKVVEMMDSTYDEEFNEFFKKTLNVDIDASSKLVDNPKEIISEVIVRTHGDPCKAGGVLRELKKEQAMSKTLLPPGKYRIIISDLTNRDFRNMLSTTISSICESDCILFTWVLPSQVDAGLRLCKQWGFKYITCLLWSKDRQKDITLNGEILLVSVKGNPTIIFKNFEGEPEKPVIIEEIIRKGYTEWSKVEIFVDDGWKFW